MAQPSKPLDSPYQLGWTLCVRSDVATVPQGQQSHWSLDLEVLHAADEPTTTAANPGLIAIHGRELRDGHSTLFTADLFGAVAHRGQQGRCTILRLLFPQGAGTPARSDFLNYRLDGCELVRQVRSFLKPLCTVSAIAPDEAVGIDTSRRFLQLLNGAIGGIVAQSATPGEKPEALCHSLDVEFENRLSFPWLIKEPLERRRVFWVQGRANIEASRQFYQAAEALGIDLVVLDEPGHWMEDDSGPYAHLREAFIPISIDGDEGLTQRIVDAVKSYPQKVDGVVSISDVRLPLVARACEILGLPTSPSAAYRIAGDKGATRRLEDAANGSESFVLESAEELDGILAGGETTLKFPLIVKPCTGWNSDCVVKVRNQDELYAAVRRASARHASSPARNTGVVVEPYIDGPEVDANFIILDGEVLFCDITDDFPCSGDLTEGTFSANFMETLMDVPSALPSDEQIMMRESLRESIARCGFQSGVFHCEARVRGSRAYYKPRLDNGILDLHVREGELERAPSCYLHEVNARSPGYINCVAALLAYGVDYYAIRLLLALGSSENARIKALAQPFLGGKPQYTLGIVVLPPTREGIMGSEDAVREFLEANPDLREHVVFHQTIKQRGEVVQGPDSSELWCVGYVIVASRQGRKECLELSERIRERFDYKLMDEK
ncbi:hypothetical protein MFIFM68171_09989 [Madurella fahalii]|uniref:ATP-grasp domain-containing protein n=1 Tax=Madurella fahalii TaxID=1157608 RepID=A0ABQ0GPZ4_9PEZI